MRLFTLTSLTVLSLSFSCKSRSTSSLPSDVREEAPPLKELLAAIDKDPTSDDARLAYANALQVQKDPALVKLGTFIKAQVVLENSIINKTKKEYGTNLDLARTNESDNLEAAREMMPEFFKEIVKEYKGVSVAHRRGFPAVLTIPHNIIFEREFLSKLDALRDDEIIPKIESLIILDPDFHNQTDRYKKILLSKKLLQKDARITLHYNEPPLNLKKLTYALEHLGDFVFNDPSNKKTVNVGFGYQENRDVRDYFEKQLQVAVKPLNEKFKESLAFSPILTLRLSYTDISIEEIKKYDFSKRELYIQPSNFSAMKQKDFEAIPYTLRSRIIAPLLNDAFPMQTGAIQKLYEIGVQFMDIYK